MYALAHKLETALGIQHDNQVWKAFDQAPDKFLFLVKFSFHFVTLGDITSDFRKSLELPFPVAQGRNHHIGQES